MGDPNPHSWSSDAWYYVNELAKLALSGDKEAARVLGAAIENALRASRPRQ